MNALKYLFGLSLILVARVRATKRANRPKLAEDDELDSDELQAFIATSRLLRGVGGG
jgi:hypothetical protein